jgi:hypothetical protein
MKTHILVGFFSVFALLSACGLPPEAVATQTAIANTAIASAWTSAPSPTVTLTHTATLTPTPTYTPTPTSTPTPTEQLDQAEQKWAEQGITRYRIEVLVVSIWHAQSHQITVQNNQVVDAQARCIPAPMELGACEVRANTAEDYIVPGLFALARSEIQSEQAAWVQITYHPSYGFPSQVSFDDPELVDEDWGWRVTAFEVVK